MQVLPEAPPISNILPMKIILLLSSLVLTVHATAAVSNIPATGWNHDMVINGAGPYALSVTGTMDGGFGQPENWTWVEAGTYLNPDGNSQTIPGFIAGTHASLTGNGTFTFQPFTGNNALGLNGGQSGVLGLDVPAAYTAISLYGASGFGPKTATVTLTFTDTSTTAFNVASGTGIGTDWFNTGADKAFAAGARASNRGEDGNTRIFIGENAIIGINESYFTLAPADQLKLLQSVTVTNTGGDRMAIFALSGEAVPEPSSTMLFAACGMAGLLRRRRA